MSTEDTIPFEAALEALKIVDETYARVLTVAGIREDRVAEIVETVHDVIAASIDIWPTDG